MTPETTKALLWNSRVRLRQLFSRIPFFDYLEFRDLMMASTMVQKKVENKEVLIVHITLDVIHKRSWHEFEKFLLYGDTKHRFSPIVDTAVTGRIGKAFVCRFAPNSALYVVRPSTGEAKLLFCHRFQNPCDAVVSWQELVRELPIKGFPMRTMF